MAPLSCCSTLPRCWQSRRDRDSLSYPTDAIIIRRVPAAIAAPAPRILIRPAGIAILRRPPSGGNPTVLWGVAKW
jgi:hypothetical protein